MTVALNVGKSNIVVVGVADFLQHPFVDIGGIGGIILAAGSVVAEFVLGAVFAGHYPLIV